MNIELSREIIDDCIINSKMFRDKIIDSVTIHFSNIHDEILKAMNDSSQDGDFGLDRKLNKIRFLKTIRELSRGRCHDIAERFPSIIGSGVYYRSGKEDVLTLFDAKNIAELFILQHG